MPAHYLREVAHFFERYKDLEGKRTEALGWDPGAAARDSIRHAMELYAQDVAETDNQL